MPSHNLSSRSSSLGDADTGRRDGKNIARESKMDRRVRRGE